MAFQESNRAAVIYALEQLQLKLNSLQNEKTDPVIQHDCHAIYDNSELSKNLKETQDQCLFLTRQIKKIYKNMDEAKVERRELCEKIDSIQRSQTQSCSDINMLLQMQDDKLKMSHSQAFIPEKKLTCKNTNFAELSSKAIRCGAVSLERYIPPVDRDQLVFKKNIDHSSLYVNNSQSNNSNVNDLPVKEINLKSKAKEDKYQFDFSNMPFTVGKSVNPSHSLMANFQEVLSLMKQHHKIYSTYGSSKSINTQTESRSTTQSFKCCNYIPNAESQEHKCCNKCGSSMNSLKSTHATAEHDHQSNSRRRCRRTQKSSHVRSRSAASFKLLKNIQKMQNVLKTDASRMP